MRISPVTPTDNDAVQLIAWEIPGFVKLRDGEPVAYLFATLFGHAAFFEGVDLVDPD